MTKIISPLWLSWYLLAGFILALSIWGRGWQISLKQHISAAQLGWMLSISLLVFFHIAPLYDKNWDTDLSGGCRA